MAPADHKFFLSVLPLCCFVKSKHLTSFHHEIATTVGSCKMYTFFTLPTSSPFKNGPHHSFAASWKVNILHLHHTKQHGPSDRQLIAQPLSLTVTACLFNQPWSPPLVVLCCFAEGKDLASSPCEIAHDIRSTSSWSVFSLFSLWGGPS